MFRSFFSGFRSDKSAKPRTMLEAAKKFTNYISDPIHYAIGQRKPQFAITLICDNMLNLSQEERRSIVNQQEENASLLRESFLYGQYRVSAYLLQHDVERNASSFWWDEKWQLPLTIAIRTKDKVFTRLLILSGAKLDIPDPGQAKKTPREIAQLKDYKIMYPFVEEVEKQLLEITRFDNEARQLYGKAELGQAAECYAKIGDIYVQFNQDNLKEHEIAIELVPFYLTKALDAYQQALNMMPSNESNKVITLLMKMTNAQEEIGDAYYQYAELSKQNAKDKGDLDVLLPFYAKQSLDAYDKALEHRKEIFKLKPSESNKAALLTLLQKIEHYCAPLGQNALTPYKAQQQLYLPTSAQAQNGHALSNGTHKLDPAEHKESPKLHQGSNGHASNGTNHVTTVRKGLH